MKYSKSIKPISYLKANAARVVREVCEDKQPLIITQNGEAKVVVQDVETYEETEATLTMLKLLAMSSNSKAEGKYKPAKQAFKEIRKELDRRLKDRS